jgi:branched-subunit amino acid aminotransferase/4-amino-4-deoxychorismate lyase
MHWLDFEEAQLFEVLDLCADAIVLLNSQGRIAYGPGFNIFAVGNGTLVTPAKSAPDGTSRRTAPGFLTTSASGILPVAIIDGKVIDKGPVRITARLHEAYWKLRAHGPPHHTAYIGVA